MRPIAHSPRRDQRGIIMVVTLVALAVLMLGGVALMRSSDTFGALSGQLGFRRDLKNQGDRAMAMAINALKSGTLSSSDVRLNNLATSNYSAAKLDSNGNGIPKVLLKSDSDFKEAGYEINIVDADSSGANATSGIKARYVIDRLCSDAVTIADANCAKTYLPLETAIQDKDRDMTSESFRSQPLVIYRITVRVDGPRGTQAFFQSTVAL
jgi:type IV pilus assembly protein PilX